MDRTFPAFVNTRTASGLSRDALEAHADEVDETALQPPVSGNDEDDVDEIDEIDVGGPLLPARIASLAQRRSVRWASRVLAIAGALGIAVALGAGVAKRFEVLNGIGSAVPLSAANSSAFDRVLALAHQPKLTGNIRQASPPGGCTTVAPGYSPERAVLSVLRESVLADPSAIQAARTLDQFTGLCSLALRATGPGGVRMVVLISAPPANPGLFTLDAVEVGLENLGPESVEYVEETMHTGWQILIGAVGRPDDLPRTSDLARAAGEPQLQW